MGILTQIQEQDERNAATEILPDLISKLDSVEQHLSKLTKHISDQTAYIKSADENTTAQLESLLISQPGEQHLTEFVEMRNRLIEKTIDAVAETLTASRHVALPDGTTVRSADFQAYNLTQRINNQLKTMVSSCDHLTKEVRQRGTVRINTDKLTQHCLDVLDGQLAAAVKGPLQRVEHRLDGLEGRVSSLGAKEISRAVGEVERATTKTDGSDTRRRASYRQALSPSDLGERRTHVPCATSTCCSASGGWRPDHGGLPRARHGPPSGVGVGIVRSGSGMVGQGTNRTGDAQLRCSLRLARLVDLAPTRR